MDVILLIILICFLLTILVNIPNGFYILFLSYKSNLFPKKNFIPDKSNLQTSYPSISLLLPVLNEESQVLGLLNNICHLEYPGKLEVILLDDGSKDRTLEHAIEFSKTFQPNNSHNLQIMDRKHGKSNESRGKFDNLNRGLKRATGEIIGVFDADSRLEKDALMKVASEFSDINKNVAGIQIPWMHRNKNSSWLTKIFVLGIEIHQQILQKGRSVIGVMIPTYGSGEFWRSEILESFSGWNDVITEDIELSYRIQMTGKKVFLSFATFSNQLAPLSLASFIQQQSRWAGGFFQTFRRLGLKIMTNKKVSLKSKIDSILLMLFYGLPAFTYLNFLLFIVLGLFYQFTPLFQPEISILISILIFLLLGGLFLSIIYQTILFKRRGSRSVISSLGNSIWLSITGLALSPFFFKAMVFGLIKKKMEFKVTPKQKLRETKIGLKRFFPASPSITFIFVFHAALSFTLLIYAFSILNFTYFLSVLGYLSTLLITNIIFAFLSY